MFQYEYEKRPPSASSFDSRTTFVAPNTTEFSRRVPNAAEFTRREPTAAEFGQREPNAAEFSRAETNASRMLNAARASRPLPPAPRTVPVRMPAKTTVPLKVWIIASASCFAVCAALVLATIVITRWGTYPTEVYERPEPIYANYYPKHMSDYEETTEDPNTSSEELDNEIQMPILEKLSIFKNIITNRDKNRDLLNKPQLHPVHDVIHHNERKIEKKDKAKLPDSLKNVDLTKISKDEANEKIISEVKLVPEFKPIRPDLIQDFKPEIDVKMTDIKLPEGYMNDLKNKDYEEYYNDENLYDDYMQSNTMTSYLIEKVQELHDWITSDPDFEKVKNSSKAVGNKNEFGQLLKALNESLLEGNATIVMNKLRDMYFGDNYTNFNNSRKIILTNGTDLLSFGILTLDVMLLHNIQLMAWENQEAARLKMLKDPDVFAFNALFMEPSKLEAKQMEIMHNSFSKRQSLRQQEAEDFNLGANLFENVLEVGVSAARAAINLGRAYKNTKNILNQLSNREAPNIQSQLSRNIDGNTLALNHLQTSYNDSSNVASGGFYTELDCVWLLYCRNLVATAKLNAPFGIMARINGMALRMLSGELAADRALDTMLYEAMTGWTELSCNDMFPKCSKVNAASVVIENILQPLKKPQTTNRGR